MERLLIILGLLTVILTGCQKQDEVLDTPTPDTAVNYVLADLALSLPPSSSGTRLEQGVTDGRDGNNGFRGISRLSVIPFSVKGKITKSDKPSMIEMINPVYEFTGINNHEFYRYYDKVYLNHGVASFLTYGQGTKTGKPESAASVDDKIYYGSLVPKVADEVFTYVPDRLKVSAGDLSFELETIYNVTDVTTGNLVAPDEAKAIADYLTYIANTPGWKNATNANLESLYNSYISFVSSGTYGVIAGSSANIMAYVYELYNRLQQRIDNDEHFVAESEPREIAEAIQDRILGTDFIAQYPQYNGFNVSVNRDSENKVTKVTSLGSDTYDKYPSNKHLPDGAAVLQWGRTPDGSYAFIPRLQTTNTANVSSINRYTYPAELYYYDNSLIRTSNDEVPVSKYSGTGITTWKDVVDNLYTSGSVVSSNTKAVAIVDPMQYAVARLQGTVQATTTNGKLKDAENNEVSLTNSTNNSFPITGLIVSGQFPVNFDFTPMYDGPSEDNEHFVYDSYLSADEMYLTTAATAPFYTMVLQTHDYEDVTVIMEFENNSGTDFKGENGMVYNGTKFYLAGKVELSKGNADAVDASERDDVSNRVFTQDHTTVLTMKVNSLAKAYNVMPNIQSGRLEVGVEINLKWEQATPQTIVFED